MAGTLTLNLTASLVNGSYSAEKFEPNQTTVVQDAIGAHGPIINVGTSEEVIAFGDITTEGWCFLRNLDVTNYVDWGPESGGAMVAIGRLEAGEWAAFRMKPGIVLRAQANTSPVLVKMLLLED